MSDAAEILLQFKVVQLEGKLAIYESLVTEISKLERIEKLAADIKLQLEGVITVWHKCNLERANG